MLHDEIDPDDEVAVDTLKRALHIAIDAFLEENSHITNRAVVIIAQVSRFSWDSCPNILARSTNSWTGSRRW
jgi:hypothetical protein